MGGRRSAVIAAVPDAAGAAHPWLERTCRVKPSQGIPAHVTILFPFLPPAAIDDRLVDDLRALFGRFEPFSFQLCEPRRFPEVLYLAPDPPEPFVQLAEALVTAYPQHPPYEGAFDSIVPHLTVAEGATEVLDAAEADVRSSLPISVELRELELIAEQKPHGAWQRVARIPLGREG